MYVPCSTFRHIRLRYINILHGGSKRLFTTTSGLISARIHQEEISNINGKNPQIQSYKNSFGIPLINRSLERVLFDQFTSDKRRSTEKAANTANLQFCHKYSCILSKKIRGT